MTPFVVLSLLIASIAAKPDFQELLPNGANVPNAPGFGHVDPQGGGEENAFGMAFYKAGKKWTTALCNADSDGDGASNGAELGDPCCVWKTGAIPVSTTVTNPASKDTFTSAQLSALKCNTSSTPTSTEKPNTAVGITVAAPLLILAIYGSLP
jgi:hypothetical protein